MGYLSVRSGPPPREAAGQPEVLHEELARVAPTETIPLPALAPLDETAVPPSNEPEEWRSEGDYTLRVRKTMAVLAGTGQEGAPTDLEMLTYNGRPVGPTIRVRRGTTLKIRVVNELPATGEPAVETGPEQDDRPHGLYTTNLHLHGLHVSPVGNGDDVFREIPPGRSFQYTYAIPPDHPTGTFWYHPHKHCSVAYQMANGMAGALIVESGARNAGGRDLEAVPQVAAAQERVFVFQQLVVRRGADGIGRVDPNDVYTETPAPEAHPVTTINGAVLPTYALRPGEVQRWRFIHAGREEPIVLSWRYENGQPMRARSIYFHEIAVDGLATGTIVPRRFVRLYPGYRSDALIQAPAERGTYYLATTLEPPLGQDGAGLRTIVKHLARVIAAGPEHQMSLPSAAQLTACRPFDAIPAAECKVKRDLVFNYDDRKKAYHINGISFSKQTSLDRPALGTAEEWTLRAENTPTSTDDPHPFHIHVNALQVVQVEDLRTDRVTALNEGRDTVAVEPGKRLTIRIRFLDFAGKTVLHCHTLDHEDQGMMSAIEVVDPDRLGEGQPATRLTECASPAPSLRLLTARKSTWELSALRRRNVVLVFFRGMGCTHCAAELRSLCREVGGMAGTGTAVVAVSSEAIADTERALRALEVPAHLEFHLLADEA
jgi:FtsP/CotA-like multicopper oxidase with cupredoxin domain